MQTTTRERSEPRLLDHLVYRVPDLDTAIADLEARLGVRAARGGTHPGRGTRNALIGLGGGQYLEILAPDPEQPNTPSRFGPTVDAPELSTWAARSPLIETQVALAESRGLEIGPVESMSRARPDGSVLRWQLTSGARPGDGLVPFLIDWGESEHPSRVAPAGCVLVALRAEHPEPARVARWLAALDLTLPIDAAPRAALIAELDTPRGRATLR